LTKQLNEQWNKTVLLEKELVAHAEVGIDWLIYFCWIYF
jgi:hypothetical protein